jgi:hypothetical protein
MYESQLAIYTYSSTLYDHQYIYIRMARKLTLTIDIVNINDLLRLTIL